MSEEEHESDRALVNRVNLMCFDMLEASWKVTCSVCMIDPKTQFHRTRNIRHQQIWDMACAAWLHIHGEDADAASERCKEYLRNQPDPSEAYKASINND